MSREDLLLARDLINKHLLETAPTPILGLRTDRRVENVLPLPVAPTMTDPVFGTTIRRATGLTAPTTDDRKSYRTPSSGYCWSSDSKYFTIIDTNGSIWLVDRSTFTKKQLTGFATEACFSREDPDVIYGGSYIGELGVLNQYSIASGLYKQVLKLRDLVPNLDVGGRTYMRGINAASGKLTILFGGTGQDSDHYVFCGAPDAFTLFESHSRLKCNLHAIALDLTGRYVVLGPTVVDINGPNKLAMNVVWDTQTDTLTPMTVSAGGHGAIGYGVSVNNPDDADGMQYLFRNLASPNTPREIISPYPKPPAFQMASHMSWNKKRDDLVTATYRYSTGVNSPRREWDDEILEVHLDGTVERLCHHRSIVTPTDNVNSFDYWATPKPCVSPDGSSVIFTSNWNRSLGTDSEGFRQDVFLVQKP